MTLGFLVSVGLMTGASLSGLHDQTAVAIVFLAANAVGMVSVFIHGKHRGLFEKKTKGNDEGEE